MRNISSLCGKSPYFQLYHIIFLYSIVEIDKKQITAALAAVIYFAYGKFIRRGSAEKSTNKSGLYNTYHTVFIAQRRNQALYWHIAVFAA
jgi:hypothetical protein